MATRKQHRSKKKMSQDEKREKICEQVIAALELVEASDFSLPWTKLARPVNASTGAAYSGLNVFLLTVRAFSLGVSGGGWMTYKQARDLGGQVRGGEESVTGVFYKQVQRKKEDAKQGEADTECYSVMRTFSLFHTSQIDGLDPAKLSLPEVPGAASQVVHRPELEALRDSLEVPTRYGGERACYPPGLDAISMPDLGLFSHTDAAWRTWLHEVVHATGHASRLSRTFGGAFGDKDYAFEELVAELGSVILSSHFGLYADKEHCGAELEHLKSHVAYIKGWSRLLRDDPSALFRAWRLAAQAADWVQARAAQDDVELEVSARVSCEEKNPPGEAWGSEERRGANVRSFA